MIRLLAGRSVQATVVLLVMSFLVYGLIGLMPGDPIDEMLSADPSMTPEDAARLKALYGLDKPIHERYLAWLGNALSGDLGYSRLFADRVVTVIATPLGNTLILMVCAITLAASVAIPLGVAAALRPRSWVDYSVNMLAFAGISMPTFWLGILLMMLFSVSLGWLPSTGVQTVGDGSLLDRLRHLVLPTLTLGTLSIGQYARHVRAAMLEVLSQDYIRTAMAKGAGTWRVVVRHALRNALIPVVTILALDFGSLFSGALITETVFSYPGMGKLIFDSIMGNDYNLALAALLLATGMTLAGNTLADVAYARLDPRISYR